MAPLRMFIPLTKVDAVNRTVYGIATAEKMDRAGEICDYESTKPLYEKWSSDIEKTTAGKSLGNLRAMHGKIAAGKVTALAFNDAEKQIEICAKVVDEGEWQKVEEGVYTGFSQGGSYIKRWKDDNGLMRYTASPTEISLVDLPCLPDATFEVVKDGGEVEMRKFSTPPVAVPNDAVAKRAAELAGDGKPWDAYIDQARTELEAAAIAKADADVLGAPDAAPAEASTPTDGDEWEQVWKSKRDGATFKTKAELRKHHETLDAEVSATVALSPAESAIEQINEALGIAKREVSADERKADAKSGAAMKDGSFPIESRDDLKNAVRAYGRAKNKLAAKRHIMRRARALDAVDELPNDWNAKVATGDLEKAATLYSVAELVSFLAQMETLEGSLETDGPFYYGSGNTRVSVGPELTTRFGNVLVEMGDIVAGVLDELLSQIGEEEGAEAMKLAAEPSGLVKSTLAASIDKEAIDASVQKAVADVITPLRDELSKVTTERDVYLGKLESLGPQLGEILKRIKNIEEQPMPGVPTLKIVTKGDDSAVPASSEAAIEKLLEHPDALADLAIRLAQRNGQTRT